MAFGVTGCGKEESSKETASGKDGSKEFTAFMFLSGTPFNSDWEVWKEVEKKTGVKRKGVVASSNSDSVSYTHLDVYKRQIMPRPFFPTMPVTAGSGTDTVLIITAPGPFMCMLHSGMCGTGTRKSRRWQNG